MTYYFKTKNVGAIFKNLTFQNVGERFKLCIYNLGNHPKLFWLLPK